MRTQIIDLLHRHYYPTMHESIADCTLSECADQIFTLICQEIEKEENPYTSALIYSREHEQGWEYCRQRILSLLKGDK